MAKSQKRKKYRQRTSSGNWTMDKATWKEELEYKKVMGFVQ
jgi:hypothetical protein